MQRYYLRATNLAIRQAQVQKSINPLRTAENALQLYLREPRKADRDIPLVLQRPNTKLENAVEYYMIDVNDYMADMSSNQRRQYLMQLQHSMSFPTFHYKWN
jgi:hypothetical protein